jgi:hypothetical protein
MRLPKVTCRSIAAEDIFGATVCLLAATSYTRRFAEDPEDVFPHIPVPPQYAIFDDAARLGREFSQEMERLAAVT